jgi:FkbM family methyltransferase
VIILVFFTQSKEKSMRILYGIEALQYDYTTSTFIKYIEPCVFGCDDAVVVVRVPANDLERCTFFGEDRFPNTTKMIQLEFDDESILVVPENKSISLVYHKKSWKCWDEETKSELVPTPKIKKKPVKEEKKTLATIETLDERLYKIQSQLILLHGSWKDELPEQRMVTEHVRPDACVLELGGNVGRTALVIASILNDSHNLVTVEPVTEMFTYLQQNRDVNKLSFHIEPTPLSRRRLYHIGCDTFAEELEGKEFIVPPNGTLLTTSTLHQFRSRYPLPFDTLMIDCEGAFYWIVKDYPNIMNGIHTIIIENDFTNIEHAMYVRRIFTSLGFTCVFTKSGGFGPCTLFFWQVWKRDTNNK